MDKRQKVLSLLLEPSRNPTILLRLRPEPFDQISIFIPRPINLSGFCCVRSIRNHRLATSLCHPRDDLPRVVPFVCNHHRERNAFDQGFCLSDIGGLAWCQDEFHRQQPTHCSVDLGSESTSAPSQGLGFFASCAVCFFFAPAAHGSARMIVESRIRHSRSGSCRASKISSQVPLAAQRSYRRQTLFQFPNRSGRSRQGAPVRAIQRTASTNSLLSFAIQPVWPDRPGQRSLMRFQSASDIACRCCMGGLPWRGGEAENYPNSQLVVHTT